jgi:hypothetical protein
LTDINEPSGNGKPKYKPAYFRWNFDDFLAEVGHLGPIAFAAATRLMGAMWRADDCALPDDPKLLNRIIRAGNTGERARWGERLKEQLDGVIMVAGGKVSAPWLTRKRHDTSTILARKWHSPHDKPLKDKTSTSPNREYRMYNKEPANAPLQGGGVAVREEASKEEEVERPLTPDERAERLAKFEAFQASKKREAVKQNLGITESQIQQLTEAYDEHLVDEAEPENDAGGVVA